MGEKKLSNDQYDAIKRKIDAGIKLTKEELHAFAQDFQYRERIKHEISQKYIGEGFSFKRVGYAFFDVNELEEFNPDPISREAARLKNVETAKRLNTRAGRAKVLLDFYGKMLNKKITDLYYKSNEEALKQSVNNEADCILGLDPSPVTTTANLDSKLTPEMTTLFQEFNLAVQLCGDGMNYLLAASQDIIQEIPEYSAKTEADLFNELHSKLGAEKFNEISNFTGIVAVEKNVKYSDLSNQLSQIGFNEPTLGEMMTYKFTDLKGKKLTIWQAVDLIAEGKKLNIIPKSAEELTQMQNAFNNAFVDPEMNIKGAVKVPPQPKLDPIPQSSKAEVKPLKQDLVKKSVPVKNVKAQAVNLPKLQNKKEAEPDISSIIKNELFGKYNDFRKNLLNTEQVENFRKNVEIVVKSFADFDMLSYLDTADNKKKNKEFDKKMEDLKKFQNFFDVIEEKDRVSLSKSSAFMRYSQKRDLLDSVKNINKYHRDILAGKKPNKKSGYNPIASLSKELNKLNSIIAGKYAEKLAAAGMDVSQGFTVFDKTGNLVWGTDYAKMAAKGESLYFISNASPNTAIGLNIQKNGNTKVLRENTIVNELQRAKSAYQVMLGNVTVSKERLEFESFARNTIEAIKHPTAETELADPASVLRRLTATAIANRIVDANGLNYKKWNEVGTMARPGVVESVMKSSSFDTLMSTMTFDKLEKLLDLKADAKEFNMQLAMFGTKYENSIVSEAAFRKQRSDIVFGKEMFIGNYLKSNNLKAKGFSVDAKKSFGMTTDRNAIQTLSICYMLKLGYNLKDIMNPMLFTEEKQRAGQEVLNHLDGTKAGKEWCASAITVGGTLFAEEYTPMLIEYEKSKGTALFDPKFRDFSLLNTICKEIYQEKTHLKDAIVKQYGTLIYEDLEDLDTLAGRGRYAVEMEGYLENLSEKTNDRNVVLNRRIALLAHAAVGNKFNEILKKNIVNGQLKDNAQFVMDCDDLKDIEGSLLDHSSELRKIAEKMDDPSIMKDVLDDIRTGRFKDEMIKELTSQKVVHDILDEETVYDVKLKKSAYEKPRKVKEKTVSKPVEKNRDMAKNKDELKMLL